MDQLLQLLKNGNIDQFNSERPFTLDFFAADLSGLSLQGVDFSGANLEKADLSDSNFEDANLSKARLVGADLTNTNMNRCNLYRAKLDELYAETSSFEEADMRQTTLNEAEFHSCSFVGAQLTESKGRAVVWKENTCTFIDLSDVKFNEITLFKSTFEQGVLDGIRLAKSHINNCNFTQTSMSKALMASASIEQSIFDQTNLSMSNWNESTVSDCTFDFSNLTRADMTGIDTTTLNLKTCTLTDIHTDLGQKPHYPIPDPKHLFIEMPWLAMNNQQLFSCWINPETDGSVLRYLLFDCKKGSITSLGSIPSSPSLLRGTQTVSTPEGFVVLCFEQRPSNIYAIFYMIDAKGTCTRFGQIPLTYTVDFQTRHFFSMFSLRYTKGFLELYVLGRNAPRLHVHQLRFSGEFNHSAFDIPTAEGLIEGDPVFAYTKGGAACSLSVKGVGTILQPPKGFPGRFFRTDTWSENLIGAWLAVGEQGIPPQKGVFASGFEDNASSVRFHNRETVQSCDIVHDGKNVWVAYSIAPSFASTEIWISQANGIAQYRIPEEMLEDELDVMKLVKSDNAAYLVLSLINGTLQVFQLTEDRAISLGTVMQS
jgi:uncharacterized protein YjbI with pentapeptide repeats